MGILDKLLSREKEADFKQIESDKETGICIPEARRKQIEETEKEKKTEETRKENENQRNRPRILPKYSDEKPRMTMEGIFSVIDTLMVKGTVVSGKIQKGQYIKIEKKKFKIKDVQFEKRSVPHLLQGQSGAVFFDRAKGLNLKAGTIIEFRQK